MASRKSVTLEEQETIINFNKAEDLASIFTYEKSWQKHIEQRLGIKPTMNNGAGGREYQVPKSRIKPPRAPLQLSATQRQKLSDRARRAFHQKPPNRVQKPVDPHKSKRRNA